jgi:hypothetical protein
MFTSYSNIIPIPLQRNLVVKRFTQLCKLLYFLVKLDDLANNMTKAGEE